MHIAIVTAGGAGMFCGSCMHDNFWARALMAQGADVSLIPTYTPIRVDEANASLERVFLGGINVYLNGRTGWWGRIPRKLTGWLDHPSVIRLATRWSISNDGRKLGDLTLSMLKGSEGPHRAAIDELATFLRRDLKPDAVIFSNALLSGAIAGIRSQWDVPILCTLQGDDVFLDSLPPEYREQAIELISQQARGFDRFLVHTQFYRDYMAEYLRLPREQFSVLPLGIDVAEHPGRPDSQKNERLTVGYFARLAPEKGFHHLTDALLHWKERGGDFVLKVGGYQGPQYRAYFQQELKRLRQAGITVKNVGSPESLAEKTHFLRSLDVLSVPTEFLEPKGLYVLEALANGIPVVQPNHGSFTEILTATEGGILVPARDAPALADGLSQFTDPTLRLHHAERGWQGVRTHYSGERMAQATLDIVDSVLNERQNSSVAEDQNR